MIDDIIKEIINNTVYKFIRGLLYRKLPTLLDYYDNSTAKNNTLKMIMVRIIQ